MNNVNNDELRIKVAELCGLSSIQTITWYGYDSTRNAIPIPDYCNDLNACHEFERGLVDDRDTYRAALESICMDDYLRDLHFSGRALHATAEQRCRAFVATMGGGL